MPWVISKKYKDELISLLFDIALCAFSPITAATLQASWAYLSSKSNCTWLKALISW